MIWADCIVVWNDLLTEPQRRTLAREMLRLSPNNPHADETCAALFSGAERADPAGTPVFMIVACATEPWLSRAQRLRAQLVERGVTAWILTGDPVLDRPRWHDDGCIVPVSDAYESLPGKVLSGIDAFVERYGPTPIVKLDDDCTVRSSFDPSSLVRLAAECDYAGVPCDDPLHDRLRHVGKTSVALGPYGRRFHGAWAHGGAYLLGSRAVVRLAREWLLFPAEFDGEYYEDKAIGDCLRRQGIALRALPSHEALGVSVDPTERIGTPAAAPETSGRPSPAANLAPGPQVIRLRTAPEQAAPAMPAQTTQPAGARSRERIPKLLHITWVGDQSKRPDNCIGTWVEQNPGWTVKLWGNEDLEQREWVNARHIREMWGRELNGVADLMRWEILHAEGGIAVDADSVCVRPLDGWLLEADMIACWENEFARPQLIACGMVGAVPGNPFLARMIRDLAEKPTVVHDMAWKTVGPLFLTESYFKYRYTGLTILPSHFFVPDHFSGTRYEGDGVVYARQEWASTRRAYDTLHLKKVG